MNSSTVSINPSDKWCWSTCSSCFRCADKGRYTNCGKCSGRHDPSRSVLVDADDFCNCTEGILRWRAKDGRLIIRKYSTDPFNGQVLTESKTQDEKDWDAYLYDVRSRMDNPDFDPVKVIW